VLYSYNAGEVYLTRPAGDGPAMDSVVVMIHALALLLREARAYHGWTLADVADRCGVSMSVLSRAERACREPRLWLVLRICNVLGVRFSDVMRVAEEEAFPVDSGPWTNHPADMLGRFSATPLWSELGPEVLRDGSLA
jgi:transcriptional regulator with XRE-family HTH domain